MLSEGIRVGMIVSQANETTAALTTYQAKLAQDAAINISGGQAGLTMADLCELYDAVRRTQGKIGIRDALNESYLPDDIDILLATDTIQEGISIKSAINYIIIEGYTEVEVRQKLGRFRGNLDLLYIIFNPTAARMQTIDKMKVFNQLIQWQQEGNQTALAEFFGTQKSIKSQILFLKKTIDPNTNTVSYNINKPALLNCQAELNLYTRLMTDTERTVLQTYSYPLLNGAPKILNYQEDIRDYNIEEGIKTIVEKWRGIPLKGAAQQELIDDMAAAGITDKKRKIVTTFRSCCNCFSRYGIELKTGKATKADIQRWPRYLQMLKEEFKYIEQVGEMEQIAIKRFAFS